MILRRICTAAAVVLGTAVPVSAAVTIAPHAAFATSYTCDGGVQYYDNEDTGYWLTDTKNSSPYNTVFPSDSYGSNYPVVVGASPTGSWYYFGKWDICWTTDGSNSTGYYGQATLYNEGSGYNLTVTGSGSYVDDLSTLNLGVSNDVWDFQCSGSTIYLYPAWMSGYWTSYSSLTGQEYETNTTYAYQDSFTEVNGSGHPRFC